MGKEALKNISNKFLQNNFSKATVLKTHKKTVSSSTEYFRWRIYGLTIANGYDYKRSNGSRSDAINELTNASNGSANDLTDTDELLTNFH